MSSSANLQSEKPLEVAVDPRLSRGVKAFLKALNSADHDHLSHIEMRMI